MLSFLPLRKSAMERSEGLSSWIRSWWPKEEEIIQLTPTEWYSKVFCRGNFIWAPPQQQRIQL